MLEVGAFFDGLLGLDTPPQELTLGQVSVRAVLIYLTGLAMLRLSRHRFLGRNTAFDIVLGFILGALLSRAINGAAPVFETVAAGVLLLILHWLFSTAAFHSDRFNVIVNGEAIPIIRDGRLQWDQMRRTRINNRLLLESIRATGKITQPEAVQEAYLERDGSISIIPRQGDARVVEVKVEEGVQTVRIRLE